MEQIKLIIAGSRDFNNYELLVNEVNSFLYNLEEIRRLKATELVPVEIVSGGARGADKLGERFAKERSIPVKQFIPDWSVGKSAGYIRNEEMAKYATHCIIFNLNNSKGSTHMENIAKRYGLELKVIHVSKLDKLIRLTENYNLYE